LRLAYADFRNGDRADGLHVLDELAQLPGDRGETTLQEAQLLNGAGLHQEALKRIELAESAKSSSSPLVFEKAIALFGVGRYNEAAEVLTEAAPEEQNLNSALLLGSAQALAGDLPEAVKTLQAAIQLAPLQPEPYYRLALVFMQGYRNQDALQVLTGGLSVIPNSPLLLYAMGVVDEVSGRYEQAITFVRKSLEVQHDQPQVWGLRAELYEDLGQYQQAEESYQTAINLSASPEITAEYADLLVKLRRLDDAEKVLHDALSNGRQDPDLDRALGKLYNAEGRYGRAQGFLERAVSLAPADAAAHFALATCLQHLGKTNEARQEYAAAHQRVVRTESARLLRRTLVPLNSSE
jgi:tetratricopeptide (TPR) repeat protein